jgi:hypothetical protein
MALAGTVLIQQKKKPLEMRFNLTESIQYPVLTDNPENYSANGSFTKKHTILVSG